MTRATSVKKPLALSSLSMTNVMTDVTAEAEGIGQLVLIMGSL